MIEIDSHEFHDVMLATREFDKVLYRELRKAMREAGEPILKDIKVGIALIPSKSDGTVRRGLIAGTKVTLVMGGKNPGIRIKTSGKALGNKAVLAAAFNKNKFRHKVFGRDVWVDQPGHPYFGKVILDHKDEVLEKVRVALDDAAKEVHP